MRGRVSKAPSVSAFAALRRSHLPRSLPRTVEERVGVIPFLPRLRQQTGGGGSPRSGETEGASLTRSAFAALVLRCGCEAPSVSPPSLSTTLQRTTGSPPPPNAA